MKVLTSYRELIANMPVQEQSFSTKRSTWEKLIEERRLTEIFKNNNEVKISRNDILLTNDIEKLIYLVILWGYPRGMRGNHSYNIFNKIKELSEVINVPERGLLSVDDLKNVVTTLKKFSGLGISTISKFLYFRTYKFSGLEALIFDERIARVINNNIFSEFEQLKPIRTDNAFSKYLKYLEIMNEKADELSVEPAQLEMFLFIFGNNLS